MKNAIIVHAWDSAPEQHWYLEEKKLLEDLGYRVSVPKLPGGNWPKLDEWLPLIEGLESDRETIFIGHSLGTPAILRYLEKSRQKVDKVISIAGFAEDLGFDETRNFIERPFDWAEIKLLADKFIIIAQKNDPYVPVDAAYNVALHSGGDWILLDGDNHFDKMDLNLINKCLEK